MNKEGTLYVGPGHGYRFGDTLHIASAVKGVGGLHKVVDTTETELKVIKMKEVKSNLSSIILGMVCNGIGIFIIAFAVLYGKLFIDVFSGAAWSYMAFTLVLGCGLNLFIYGLHKYENYKKEKM
jgi:hypothetical protein